MSTLVNTMTTASVSDVKLALENEKLNLSGMRCAACVQLIEFRVRQLAGVSSFKINSASHRADVVWNPDLVSLKRILSAIMDLGYGALPASQSPDAMEKKEGRLALWRLFVAGFAMMQVMMYAFPAYLVPVPQIDGDLTPDLDRLLKIASMIITIPVIGFSAMPFFRSAWRDLKNRHVGMDVPVSLGILCTFLASVWATFAGGAVYFDSAIMFVFLLLGARLIESRVQKKTSAALRILTQLTPGMAQRFVDYPQQAQTEQIDISALRVGDMVLVAAGEHIPADGIVIAGDSACDEALMTGESLPVPKTAGSKLIAGAINISGALVMQTQEVGGATQLSQLIAMMEAAASEKPPLVLLADKHASRFLLIILLLSIISGVVWWHIDSARAFWIAISIVVVTCPCALSLATPGVMSAAIGILAKNGVLLTKSRAIQAMASATHIVFDKTGTLTLGKLQVDQMLLLQQRDGNEHEYERARQIAFALASRSSHPVSRAIADYLTPYIALHKAGKTSAVQADDLLSLHEVPGAGLEAVVGGVRYRLGNPGFALAGIHLDIPDVLKQQTLAVLATEQEALFLFALDDVLRDDAVAAIRQLKSKGKKILLLSGDRAEVVARVAAQCDIQNARAGLSPAGKYEAVRQLQAAGHVVVMVGDGMNDGPVLGLADVSVAMGQGAAISQSRSDMLLMSNRLLDLDFGLTLAAKAYALIRENLAWAVFYNLIAIPAAISGLLEPWHAALGMSLSSLIVVLNALRLYRLPQPLHVLQEQA
ncbi:cadmium-translocating P-type ATPase [Undibacterium sp. CY18W]|uniref:Cadmium-translocating P-type ATPase n=1 Tax=Undibacterium hunanense TaxID=2762292 RepID=A0ABR6ZLK0_9BURK|nr:cation-translocating P-type ATPase [Undibacterium hunanense]MBC3916290.1 cadmium-translocating P-type ATPase [Undibacterium hunanense]